MSDVRGIKAFLHSGTTGIDTLACLSLLKSTFDNKINFKEILKIIIEKICPVIKDLSMLTTSLYYGTSGYLYSVLLLLKNINDIRTKKNESECLKLINPLEMVVKECVKVIKNKFSVRE